MAEKKISVKKQNLEKVVEELRNRGLSSSDISDEIGARIDSYLYNDYNMSREAFDNLVEVYGDEIPHDEITSTENNVNTVPILRGTGI